MKTRQTSSSFGQNSSIIAFSRITWSSASKLVLILWLLSCTNVEAQILSDNPEIVALIGFKFLTYAAIQTGSGGFAYEPRGFWDSWKETDKTPCNWVGVSCNANNSVRAIDLSGWGLSKQWGFADLSNLKDLEQLILSNNDFNTKIEADIGNVTSLTHLDLSNSNFIGEIPATVNQLLNLRSLNLAGNGLSGEVPRLDNLKNLQVMSLARNQLTGPVPSHLGDLQSLVSLDLSSNLLNGSVPVLTKLTNLLELNLNNNTLTGFKDPRFPGPKNLKHLFVSDNQLQDKVPVGLVDMLNLEVLNLSGNNFSGTIPEGLSRQTNHSFWLDLSRNRLTGRIPEDLLLPQEQYSVSSLNLSYNLLTGSIPEVGAFNDSWFYAALDLSHNLLSGSLPHMFGNYSQFHILSLEDNKLSGDIVDILDGFVWTKELKLANNRFTGDLTRMVDKWGYLTLRATIIDLSDNMLTMSKTENYSDPMRETFQALVVFNHLLEFRIAGNDLSGISLPTEWLRMGPQTLEILDVSRNHLLGSIVEEAYTAFNFPKIKVLNFSDNLISGSIPLNITLLPNLIALDVSNNNLSGKLPAISKTSGLWNANLYAGNPGLCGGPLAACPSPPPPLPPPTVIYVPKNGKLSWWLIVIIVLSSILVPIASSVIVVWRWRLYKKLHEQDADLIATLMERDTATIMPLRELKRATDNFADKAEIGVGGFGTVYTGKLSDGTVVAIKRSKREGTEADKQQFLNEVRILSQVNHRYLVKLLGCCMENKVALLVFEYVPNGTVQEHLRGKRGSWLTWKQRLHIAVQTADALNYLHSAADPPIIHRDVKSANILLDDKFNVKVADFGISKLARSVEATHVSTVAIQGTMGYIDPEYYTSFQLTGKSDVFSFGVVLLELISAQSAFDFKRASGDASLITYAVPLVETGDLHSLIDPVLRDSCDLQTEESMISVGRLARKCLEPRSKDRPDMNEVWKQLQTIWLSFHGTSDDSDSTSFTISGGSEADFNALLNHSVENGRTEFTGSCENSELHPR